MTQQIKVWKDSYFYYDTKVDGIKLCCSCSLKTISAKFAHRKKTPSKVLNRSFSSTGNVKTDRYSIHYNNSYYFHITTINLTLSYVNFVS
jgi:hypothetical protein